MKEDDRRDIERDPARGILFPSIPEQVNWLSLQCAAYGDDDCRDDVEGDGTLDDQSEFWVWECSEEEVQY